MRDNPELKDAMIEEERRAEEEKKENRRILEKELDKNPFPDIPGSQAVLSITCHPENKP